jgi:hypothetical protein
VSRVGEYDDWDENFNNEAAFWRANAERALKGKRGRKALADLREALLALPEKRLIANAFSTVGKPVEPEDPTLRKWYLDDHRHLIEDQGEGVCTVAAFVWHQRVKAGADPQQALVDLPLYPDYEGEGSWHTEKEGVQAGLSQYVAWTLMQRNDDHLDHLTPEDRWVAVMAWIDQQLGATADA